MIVPAWACGRFPIEQACTCNVRSKLIMEGLQQCSLHKLHKELRKTEHAPVPLMYRTPKSVSCVFMHVCVCVCVCKRMHKGDMWSK